MTFSNVFAFVELQDGNPRKVAMQALGEARRTADAAGKKLIALIVGQGAAAAAKEAIASGADEALAADEASLEPYRAGAFVKVLADYLAGQKPFALYAGNTAIARDVLPRLAQRLGAAFVGDVTGRGEESGRVVERPIYAGKAKEMVEILSESAVITVRANAFATPEKNASRAGTSGALAVNLDDKAQRTTVKDVAKRGGGKVDLTEADVVVTGGIGLGKPEGFEFLQQLVDAFGGALGSSRAAVMNGWISHEHQVGQTGKTVSPALYVACGVSGAIQHQAGMSSSKCIVAINKDVEAPIFKIADYGIVGDLYQIVPPLAEEVKKMRQD